MIGIRVRIIVIKGTDNRNKGAACASGRFGVCFYAAGCAGLRRISNISRLIISPVSIRIVNTTEMKPSSSTPFLFPMALFRFSVPLTPYSDFPYP
jgi:hypothetical protein